MHTLCIRFAYVLDSGWIYFLSLHRKFPAAGWQTKGLHWARSRPVWARKECYNTIYETFCDTLYVLYILWLGWGSILMLKSEWQRDAVIGKPESTSTPSLGDCCECIAMHSRYHINICMLLTLCNGGVHLVHSVGHVRCDIVQDLMAQHGALGKTYSWPVAMLQCPCHAIGTWMSWSVAKACVAWIAGTVPCLAARNLCWFLHSASA